ncbi:unnamed protein product [Caenorhabditis sp. 36 PRJEB53466]|nr:unnamed protein product [Caenorhabditis sp. 36 PRJEB53466]
MFLGAAHRSVLLSLFVLALTVSHSSCRLVMDESTSKADDVESPSCAVLADEPVGEVMERICDMCHELSSHSRPNMRLECRANCFSTDAFRECLKLFTPRRHTRHLRSKY